MIALYLPFPRRYTLAMRECIVLGLVLLCVRGAGSQAAPAGWKLIRDAKALRSRCLCRGAEEARNASIGAGQGGSRRPVNEVR